MANEENIGKVKITNQKFFEAGGREAFPDLEMCGVIFAHSQGSDRLESVMQELYEGLSKKAITQGCTHIFGFEYRLDTRSDQVYSSNPARGHLAIGTGYKRID